MNLIIEFLVAATIMALIDFVWLKFIAKSFYSREMKGLLRAKPDMLAATLFYIIYIIGVVVFVVDPALQSGSLIDALIKGGLFGLVAYATYDLTSLSVIKGFGWKIAVIDLIWGSFLTAMVACGSYAVITALS